MQPSQSEIDKLIKIMEIPNQIEILKEIAENESILHYITFYERYREVFGLSGNVNNTIEQQVVRKKVKDLGKEYLFETAPHRILVSVEALEGLATNIQNCGSSTLGNKIDISFLKPIINEVLGLIATSCLPLYKRAMEQKNSVIGRNYLSKVGGSGSLGSILSIHRQPNISAPSPTQITSEALENLIKVLNTPTEVEFLKRILEKQHCMENWHYYERQKLVQEQGAVSGFRILSFRSLLGFDKGISHSLQTLKDMILAIASEFVVEGAPQELNMSAKVRYEFEEKLQKDKISVSILEPVTNEVLDNLLRNSFPVYKKLKSRDRNS